MAEEQVEQEEAKDATGGGEQPEGQKPETTPATEELSQPKAESEGEQPTFTQAQVEAMIKERVAREQKKFEGYEKLQEQAKKWSEYEDAQKTELERQTERADRAEARIADMQRQVTDEKIRSAIYAQATAVGARYPEDVYNLVDLSEVVIDEDGRVHGADRAVKTLLDDGRLVLAGKPQAPSLDGGAGSGDRSTEHVRLSQEELEIARKMGLKPEDYAKGKK